MKFRSIKFYLIIFIVIFSSLQVNSQSAFDRENLFDSGWRFHLGGAQGAESPQFIDSQWRKIDLPHDWSIEDLPGTLSPFSINAISQVSGGFTTGGTGWYRKSFSLPENLKGKVLTILFEGVYMNAEVWLNGRLLGNHPYGYTSFWFDISDAVKFEGENILCVKVKNEGENSRWYSGSGIYRHVWLQITNPVHIAQWGTSITTPKVSSSEALISVSTTLVNQTSLDKSIKLITRLYDKKFQELSKTETVKTLASGKSFEWTQEVVLKNPLLWSPDSPDLYKAVSEVYTDEKLSDKTEIPFGIRSVSFDPVNGFRLNGKALKLKGGCVHHDNGPLG
jgi:beta-galactosidase